MINKFYSNFYLILFLISASMAFVPPLKGQNAFKSDVQIHGWGTGWETDMVDYWSHIGFGTTYGKTYQNSIGSGQRYFRLYTDWDGQQREHGPTGEYDIQLNFGVGINLTTGNSKAYYVQTSGGPNNYNYIFRTRNGDGRNNPQLVVFEVQGAVQSVNQVSQSPLSSAVTSTNPVVVTANLSGPLSVGQGVYLRYTNDFFATSSIIQMTGNATTYTAQIPAQLSGTNVRYYVFTSGSNLTIGHSDADWFTINGHTNNGNNFSYTVHTTPAYVTVTPSYPLDNQQVTITFDASSTVLSGANKVYLHSGVSNNVISPTSFNHTTGNWGQDDGVGEMNLIAGKWEITLPSLRNYFNVPEDKDLFGLNFLFRSADGSLKEDNNGTNFYFPVNPGNYFTLDFPSQNTHFTQIDQPFNVLATANSIPTEWILVEVNPETDIEIGDPVQSSGTLNFSTSISTNTTSARKFKLSAIFGETTKSKSFFVIGYAPINVVPKPAGVKPGINYHETDSTQVTLVLHAPTSTRYKNGSGLITGMNNSTPKNLVFVIGDFNNWTPSESFKMYKDPGTVDEPGDFWWLTLTGLTPGQEYVFQYLIDGHLQIADPYTHKVSDPDDRYISEAVYPELITYRPQAVDRASVLQTLQKEYKWTADPFSRPTINNLNIYELHFRDFTEEGTYLAAIEKLDYIKGLGINAIHVMPVSEFEGNSSWGYNPNFYFAADKAYGPADDLKKFIDECHLRKIQVFNDVVLNHAFYSNVMARMYWNTNENKPANDNPWFNPNHKMVRNQAGWWGADWNHESEHTQKMVDSILGYWLKEFRFDGFRFDFTKGFGQTDPNNFPPFDDWASSKDDDRIDLLKKMVQRMTTKYPGSVVIFEHLANSEEDKILADSGILMWSGVGHHEAIKRFILGNTDDNRDIYTSGVYNALARNFMYANWMSYAESHDEERLGFEVKNYFNWISYSGPKNTASDSLNAIINRLKIGLAFNLMLPGPRMIWQFQELGYDYSINYCPDGTINGSCRTDPKPVRWDYFDDPKRKELFELVSYLFKLRNDQNLYHIIDYDNIGNGGQDINTPKRMSPQTVDGKQVIIVANLDPTNIQSVLPGYIRTGTWYRFNGQQNLDPIYEVEEEDANYVLSPSEVLILTNFDPHKCTDVRVNSNSGPFSLRNAIECATDGDEVRIEFPVYNQTIILNSPISIEKNITITGFPSKRINISVLNQEGNNSVFSISENKSVTLNGLKITCAQGNSNGWCIFNNGLLTMDTLDLQDLSDSAGNTIYNTDPGQIIIKREVSIQK